jgi:hypothetical protein
MCTDYLIKKYILYCTWSHDITLTNFWKTPDTSVGSDLALSKCGISKSTLEVTQHSFVISILNCAQTSKSHCQGKAKQDS